MDMDTRAKSVGFSSYAAYLASNHWKHLVASWRKGSCFCCKASKSLQLHHITYDRFGSENQADLVTVCDSCHAKIHSVVRQGKAKLENAHFLKFRPKDSKKPKAKKWVSNWRRLVNKSLKQNTHQLMVCMMECGLIEGTPPKATAMATRRGFEKDGKWNRIRCITIMRKARAKARM